MTKKKPTIRVVGLIGDVGVARFELTASCSQSRRDTGLRYTPLTSRVKVCGETGIRTRGTVTRTTV